MERKCLHKLNSVPNLCPITVHDELDFNLLLAELFEFVIAARLGATSNHLKDAVFFPALGYPVFAIVNAGVMCLFIVAVHVWVLSLLRRLEVDHFLNIQIAVRPVISAGPIYQSNMFRGTQL